MNSITAPSLAAPLLSKGDNPLYHSLRREFTLTEGSAPGTRGSLGSECRDRRGFRAEFGGKRQVRCPYCRRSPGTAYCAL